MAMLRKHQNNTDVAIEILKCFFVREKREFALKVRWWNIACKRLPPYDMKIDQKIRISLEDWKKWDFYRHPTEVPLDLDA
jgi:hypothetical protein